MKINWKKFGGLLSWVGAIYLVGFGVFAAVSTLVLLPRYQSQFRVAGSGSALVALIDFIGPLTIVFMIIAAAAWYQGRELQVQTNLSVYDKLVAAVIFGAVVFVLTPELYLSVTSIIPAIKP